MRDPQHIVKVIGLSLLTNGGGKLFMLFEDGSNFDTNFESYSVLCGFVRRWGNVYGAPLLIGGRESTVQYNDKQLVFGEKFCGYLTDP